MHKTTPLDPLRSSSIKAELRGCEGMNLPLHAGKVGLRNLGNTCFMNAGLQCLSHIEPFAAYFLSGRYREDLNRSSNLGYNGELAQTLAEVQKLIWQSANASAQNPRDLHRKLGRCAPHLFKGYGQQDVQEFLAFCLDGLHEDLNRVVVRPPPTTEKEEKDDEILAEQNGEEFAAALAWMRYLERGKSFLVDLLQGQLRSKLTCGQCGHESRRFDPFLYLSLPVAKGMSAISDAIEKYLEEEQLSADNQWFCEKCNCKVDASKKIDLWKLPPVLVVHLKRFEYDSKSERFKKIDKLLSCPPALDLSSYCSAPQRDGANYNVVCVANHIGSYGSGHYTANCRIGKTESSPWYCFNDDRVTKLKAFEDVIAPTAYVLFLVRCNESICLDGKRTKSIVRQTVTMPEVWPHWISTRNSKFFELMPKKESAGREVCLEDRGFIRHQLSANSGSRERDFEDQDDRAHASPCCRCLRRMWPT